MRDIVRSTNKYGYEIINMLYEINFALHARFFIYYNKHP